MPLGLGSGRCGAAGHRCCQRRRLTQGKGRKDDMASLEARMTVLTGERETLRVEKGEWEKLIAERQGMGRVFPLPHEQAVAVREELRVCEQEMRVIEQRLQRREGAMEELEGAARALAAGREERWREEIEEMEAGIAERRGRIEESGHEETGRRARWAEMREAKQGVRSRE